MIQGTNKTIPDFANCVGGPVKQKAFVFNIGNLKNKIRFKLKIVKNFLAITSGDLDTETILEIMKTTITLIKLITLIDPILHIPDKSVGGLKN